MNNITLFFYSYDPSHDQSYLSHHLNQSERLHHRTLKSLNAQNAYITSRSVLRTAFSKLFNLDAHLIETQKGRHGKPSISRPENCAWRFNISHTLGISAVAFIEDFEIGLDIENHSRKSRYMDIAKMYFHPEELRDLTQIVLQKEQQTYFYKLWTLKEAYLKALGSGLTKPLDSFRFALNETGNVLLFEEDARNKFNSSHFTLLTLSEHYTCAISVLSDKPIKAKINLVQCNFNAGTFNSGND